MEHKGNIRAKYRVMFTNGHTRDVCAQCAKMFKGAGKYAHLVDTVESIKI